MSVRNLEPKAVWNYFEDLNAVPRPSKKEERVREFMVNFGKSLGLDTQVDKIGNVIIKKAASKGFEAKPTVILQSHIDMVHQKNSATEFDFSTQGIQSYIDGEWVKAKGTTLGADNGMGVAATMAVLASKDISHPAIEALFTIDEETGMTGAKELDGSLLSGKILLNLDTEDDDEFSVGCAGGIDTNTFYTYQQENVPANFKAIALALTGLKGGHSGMDINLGRGNANLLMNRLIYAASQIADLRIAELTGGSLRNAIPRESHGVLVVDSAKADIVLKQLNKYAEIIKGEYRFTEPDFKFEAAETKMNVSKMISKADQDKALRAIYTTPNAVWKMSETIPGLVETSSSLAKVTFKDGEFTTQSLQRSMVESGKEDIANAIRLTYELIGARVVQDGSYPGWAPDPDSRILKVMEKQYVSLFKDQPKVKACHAGLECGILGEHLPGCDMISFGPTIRNPHSPDEKVHIQSVQKFWNFLLEVLNNIPSAN
ncbi:MAG: aminoacyl-histidine dipeptidase [Crocinitomicaceae bacterium]|nr:aminoacyl-histidine dipeptidase [Crocinitomicaceae bacterium]MBK8925803.1 aminoacyl-histidine dipeptidase [Crocinitomicaceae bacterium]